MAEIRFEIDMQAVGNNIVAEIQEQLLANESVKSGELKNGWDIVVRDDEVIVSTTVPYAGFVNDKKQYIFLDNIRARIASNIRGTR